MPGPNITFAFIIATLLGALFHLIAGGDAGRLTMYLLTGWVGFALGHAAGDVLGLNFLSIGTLNIVTAMAGSIFALITVYGLTTRRNGSRRTSR